MSETASKPREPSAASASHLPIFQGMDLLELKKRGQDLRSWIRVDAATGSSQVIEVDKFTMMQRCDLPARDLRLLDPLLVHPSTILGRERAIVINLEQIRCIITADEVFITDSPDVHVMQYVEKLQHRLTAQSGDVLTGGSTSPDDLPFEFRALETAIEATCTFLDSQVAALESEAYPVLDELTSKISEFNLEHVRRLKRRLVALTWRVQKARDAIEQLMDDDGDMAEMYLTEKKRRKEASFHGDQSIQGFDSIGAGVSENVVELEMLLEAYFVLIDGTLNKLTSLTEYIDDTEDFINIQLDNVRNQLIQFELLLTVAAFVIAIFGVVTGIFGMNFPVTLFQKSRAFQWVLIITGVSGVVIFCSFLAYLRYRRLFPFHVRLRYRKWFLSALSARPPEAAIA
ncbi:magnesium transporter MRS2-1 isoform X2 [Elaeis guineensis]|uniref:magnesium transporter MRS2-1 isoform X2 n=1 Tax=Elaeis guineensis var. tenera TaxID=51953 RepID=UPI003C6D9A22